VVYFPRETLYNPIIGKRNQAKAWEIILLDDYGTCGRRGYVRKSEKNLTTIGRQMSLSRVRRYMTMLAQGIFHIHQHGVSHLDLSMENILITNEDEIRICDFVKLNRNGSVVGLKASKST